MLLYDIEVYLTFSEDFSREKPDRVHLFLVIARLVYVHNMHVTLMWYLRAGKPIYCSSSGQQRK